MAVIAVPRSWRPPATPRRSGDLRRRSITLAATAINESCLGVGVGVGVEWSISSEPAPCSADVLTRISTQLISPRRQLKSKRKRRQCHQGTVSVGRRLRRTCLTPRLPLMSAARGWTSRLIRATPSCEIHAHEVKYGLVADLRVQCESQARLGAVTRDHRWLMAPAALGSHSAFQLHGGVKIWARIGRRWPLGAATGRCQPDESAR